MINVIDHRGPTLPLKPDFDSRIGNDFKEDGDRVVVTRLGARPSSRNSWCATQVGKQPRNRVNIRLNLLKITGADEAEDEWNQWICVQLKLRGVTSGARASFVPRRCHGSPSAGKHRSLAVSCQPRRPRCWSSRGRRRLAGWAHRGETSRCI